MVTIRPLLSITTPLPLRSVPSDSAVRALDGTIALTLTTDWTIAARSGARGVGELDPLGNRRPRRPAGGKHRQDRNDDSGKR